MPRNAFELGISALIELKRRLGEKVQIFSAGANWDPNEYHVGGSIENLGKLPYETLPKFYRSMDVGLMFMFSGHPGVVASELMASGCPVVVNYYNDETWRDLYQNERTCLVSYPTATVIAENLERCLLDKELRAKIIPLARKKISEMYKSYPESCKKTADILTK
jgi:glycosyltransferase involved in cell wall biosynthesis